MDDLREREARLLRALWTISKGSMRSPYSPYTYINKIISPAQPPAFDQETPPAPLDAPRAG